MKPGHDPATPKEAPSGLSRSSGLWEARPATRRQCGRRHLPWALLAWGGLVAGWLFPFRELGPLCPFLRLTGWSCMFCGLTRAFAAVSQGAWPWAWQRAPIVFLIYLGVWGVALIHTAALLTGRCLFVGPRLAPYGRWPWWLGLGGSLLLLNWIYRLYHGLS